MRHLLASLAVKPTRTLQATYTRSCSIQLSYFLFTHSLVSSPLNLKIQPMGPSILCYGLHAVFDLSSSCQLCLGPPNSAPSGVLCTPILYSWHELVKENAFGSMFSNDRNLSDLDANRKGQRKPYAPHGSPIRMGGPGCSFTWSPALRGSLYPSQGNPEFSLCVSPALRGRKKGQEDVIFPLWLQNRGPCLPSPCPRERCSKRRPHTCLHFN